MLKSHRQHAEERLFMPKLPEPMKKHLFLKTPKLRQHIDPSPFLCFYVDSKASQAQKLLDLAKLSGPEAVEEMHGV